MTKPKIGINGIGRIGRMIMRNNLELELLDIVAVNDLASVECAAHLIKYDSLFGALSNDVKTDGSNIVIDGHKIHGFSEREADKIPWSEYGVEIVLECTGFFDEKELASKHLRDTVKKVIISAPAKGADKTIVLGVNEKEYDSNNHHVISNASCTTNCLAPMAKVLDDNFGIKRGLMTTIHSYTGDQRLHDNIHRDFRRARAANISMIPTTTGAARAIGEVLPQLKGKLDGLAIRVPTPTVSITDLVCELNKETTKEEINSAFKKASETTMNNILRFCEEPLVSIDFRKDPHSSIIDAASTYLIEKNLVKTLSWYDNEWAYARRMVELAAYIASK